MLRRSRCVLIFFVVEFLDRISDVRYFRDVRDANNSVAECCNDLTSLNQSKTYSIKLAWSTWAPENQALGVRSYIFFNTLL